MMKNAIKQKIRSGEKVLGAIVPIHSPALVEMIGHAGFDFVVIDDEHGAFSHSEIENMIRAAEASGLVPIVRVSYDPSSIQKALDRGAMGIQVPMVNSKEDAEQVVRKAKFPPLGERGAAFSVRAARYGKDGGKEYFDEADENGLVIVHIETPEAVRNFREIMSVPGIDLAFIGPTDLSVNMNYKAEGAKHPEVQQMIEEIYAAAREHGYNIGTAAGNAEGVNQAFAMGACYVGVVATSVIANAFGAIQKATVPGNGGVLTNENHRK